MNGPQVDLTTSEKNVTDTRPLHGRIMDLIADSIQEKIDQGKFDFNFEPTLEQYTKQLVHDDSELQTKLWNMVLEKSETGKEFLESARGDLLSKTNLWKTVGKTLLENKEKAKNFLIDFGKELSPMQTAVVFVEHGADFLLEMLEINNENVNLNRFGLEFSLEKVLGDKIKLPEADYVREAINILSLDGLPDTLAMFENTQDTSSNVSPNYA